MYEPLPVRPDIHPDTLGLDAVMEAADQDWYADQQPLRLADRGTLLICDPTHPATKFTERSRTEHRRAVRKQIAGFDDANLARLGTLANMTSVTNVEERRDLGLDTPEAWRDWLTGGSPAADKRLFFILGEHVRMVKQLQEDPKFVAAVEEQKLRTKTTIMKGLGENWLSERAEAAIERVDELPVYAGDQFLGIYADDPTVKGYYDGQGYTSVRMLPADHGHASTYQPSWVVQNAWGIPHEMAHGAVSDRRWVLAGEEPAASHFSDTVNGSSPDVVQTHLNGIRRTDYPAYMEALSVLLEDTDARLLLRAYSGGPEDEAKLDQAVDSRWGCTDLRSRLHEAASDFHSDYTKQNPDATVVAAAERTGRFMTNILKRVDARPRIARPFALRRIMKDSHDTMLASNES